MFKIVKVKAGMNNKSVPQSMIDCKAIVKAITGNSNFPNCQKQLSDIQTNIGLLESIENEIATGNRSQMKLRNTTFRNLKLQMASLAAVVNSEAAGDVAILESSGMEFSKEPTPVKTPETISKVSAVNSSLSGMADVRWKGDKQRMHYIVELSASPTSGWSIVAQPTKTGCTIEGLTTGQWAYFRVCAVNKAGQGAWSDVARVMVA